MAEVGVDLREAVNMDPLPDGVFEIICNTKPEAKTSSTEKQTIMLGWEFDVVGTAGMEQYDGRKLFRQTPLHGKGAGFTVQMLEGLGIPFKAEYEIPGDTNSKLIALKFDDDHCIGAKALATVSQREFTDKHGKKRMGNDFTLSPLVAGDGAGAVVTGA